VASEAYSLAFLRGGPHSIPASPCVFYAKKAARRRGFLQMFLICPVSIILPMTHTHIVTVYHLSN